MGHDIRQEVSSWVVTLSSPLHILVIYESHYKAVACQGWHMQLAGRTCLLSPGMCQSSIAHNAEGLLRQVLIDFFVAHKHYVLVLYLTLLKLKTLDVAASGVLAVAGLVGRSSPNWVT